MHPHIDLQPPREAHPTPVLRLYSMRGIELATALGSLVAGTFLISRNLRALGRIDASKQTLLLGTIGFVLFLFAAFSFHTPDPAERFMSAAMTAFQVLIARGIAQWIHIDALRNHAATGREFFSNWRAAGLGILVIPVPLALLLGVGWQFPTLPGLLTDEEYHFSWGVWEPAEEEARLRGVVSREAFTHELAVYDFFAPELADEEESAYLFVRNWRLDRELGFSVHGTSDEHSFRAFWATLTTNEERHLELASREEAVALSGQFFAEQIEALDARFNRAGSARE